MTFGNTMRQKASKLQISELETRIADLDAVSTATVSLTSAQVLALNTTPIELVPAPWAWKYINVLSVVGTVDYNSAAYATNVTLEFRYTNGSWTKVTADIAALIDATADKAVSVKGIEAATVLTANAPVVVRTATGNPATGNSPVKFHVVYEVITL